MSSRAPIYGLGMADLERLRRINGIKWTRYGSDVLPAWVADMDFDPAPEIKEAIVSMVNLGDLGYNMAGLETLTEAWLDWQESNHGWRPPKEETRNFTGSLQALEATMALHTKPGDGVVLFSPVYYPFRDGIISSGRRVVDVPLDDLTWRLNAETFEAALDADTKLVLFCQPHNPVGRVFDREELSAFADVVERHELLVVSDEIWGDLTHAPNAHLPLVVADPRLLDRTITLGSASKAFNIAGLRCAVAHIGSAKIREAMSALPPHALGSPSSTSVAATVAAWTQCGDWLVETRAEITSRRDLLASRLAAEAPEIGVTMPEATYLVWLDFSNTPIAHDPSREILKRGNVALDIGAKFGETSGAYARLNFATSEEILNEILDRVIATVRE